MFKIGKGDIQCTQRSCVPKSSSTKRPPLSCTDLSGSCWISIGTHSDPYGPSRSPEDVMCPSLQSFRHQTAPHSQPRGDENGPTQRGARNLITTNVHHACEILALNDFKILKVDFSNGLGRRCPSSARKGFYIERCLEPLKKCRAEKVSIHSVDECAAVLKLTSIVVPHPCICFFRFCFSNLCSGVESRDRRS